MKKVFGEFREDLPKNHEFLILGFSPSSIPIQKRWRNNGLSADFVADYLTAFLPMSDDISTAQQRQAEMKGAVNYIANELLENAMKFNNENKRYPIKFGLHLIEESGITIVLLASNSLSEKTWTQFHDFIQVLITTDTEELYINQIEKSAEDENSNTSGLGLLTMVNDYNAKLGWQLETLPESPDMMIVTTMAQIIF